MARRNLTPIALLIALSAGLTALGSPAGAEERGQRRQRNDGQGSQGHDGRHDRTNDRTNDRTSDRTSDRKHDRVDDRRQLSSHRQDADDSWRGRDWLRTDDRSVQQRPDDRRPRHDDSDWRRRTDDRHRGDDHRRDGDRYRNDDRHRSDWDRSRRYAPTYRYSYGGRSYDTDDYGAQFIRNALRYGYEQGVRAARQARASRWSYDVRNCDAYRDGSYGYDGLYGSNYGGNYGGYGSGFGVSFDRGQYSVYFRQGFQRGYDEAYYGRYHYGSYRNGGVDVVVGLLDLILDLRRLH